MLILASGSPRRRELLSLLHVPFAVRAPEVDERVLASEAPAQYLERIAAAKACAAVAHAEAGALAVLVADTMVLREPSGAPAVILGKPASVREAEAMLRQLSGEEHTVATRFVLRTLEPVPRERAETVRTRVRFRALGEAELVRYAQSGEGLDKAGGYAIQGGGAAFVEAIVGSYSNVVGLPLSQVAVALDALGLRT